MRINLPEITKEHEQEEKSITAFKLKMTNSNFIIRDVRTNDYGVDLNIEAKVISGNKKFASNYSAQIQIKDKLNSSHIQNTDGSYSYEIKMTTLNYLSNNPTSIFMIYLEDKDIFIWEWIKDIKKYVNKKNINVNSSTQKGITYRFRKELTTEMIKDIHTQVIQYGECIKRNLDIFCKNNPINLIKMEKLLNSFENKNNVIRQHIKNEEYNEALKLCSNLTDFIEDEELFIKCSYLSLLTKKYKKAINYCNKSLKISTNNYLVHLIKGTASLQLKHYRQAIKSLHKSLSIEETSEAYIQCGFIEFVMGNYSTAINYLNKALTLDPEDEKSMLIIGNIHLVLFNFSEATYYLQKVIKINPKNAQALALIGDSYRNEDNYDLAIEYYHKCLDIEPENEYGLMGLGLSLISINQVREGIIYISKWIKIYHERRFFTGKPIMLINIGLEKKFSIILCLTEDKKLKLTFDNGREFKVDFPHKIFVGVSEYPHLKRKIPVVGAVYYVQEDLKAKLKGLSSHMKIYDETNLYLREEKSRVYIEIEFNGLIIFGHTNGGLEKRNFYEFIRLYNEVNFFQLCLQSEETQEEFIFSVGENVSIELLKS
ncbi:tetratricopeptide repeat protein [Priestia aryabhattai]|uniref:tetratricopeptide repeat protein n=1 Tax=Priestia aryabhattai TaxID=412384 RepID=UPI003B6738E5